MLKLVVVASDSYLLPSILFQLLNYFSAFHKLLPSGFQYLYTHYTHFFNYVIYNIFKKSGSFSLFASALGFTQAFALLPPS